MTFDEKRGASGFNHTYLRPPSSSARWRALKIVRLKDADVMDIVGIASVVWGVLIGIQPDKSNQALLQSRLH